MRRLLCGFLIAMLTPSLTGCGATPIAAPLTKRISKAPLAAPKAYQPVAANRGATAVQPTASNAQAPAPGAYPGYGQPAPQATPRPVLQPRR